MGRLSQFFSPCLARHPANLHFSPAGRAGITKSLPLSPAWERARERGQDCCRNSRYSSYTAGTSREDSDIDVVVISEDFENKGYCERSDP